MANNFDFKNVLITLPYNCYILVTLIRFLFYLQHVYTYKCLIYVVSCTEDQQLKMRWILGYKSCDGQSDFRGYLYRWRVCKKMFYDYIY